MTRHTPDNLHALIEDTTFLADTGLGLHAVARRLDYKPDTLARHLERHGHKPLANKLRRQDPLPLEGAA